MAVLSAIVLIRRNQPTLIAHPLVIRREPVKNSRISLICQNDICQSLASQLVISSVHTAERKLTPAVLSNPFIELKTTSIALGSTPLSALLIVFPPDTEYVFPELLTP